MNTVDATLTNDKKIEVESIKGRSLVGDAWQRLKKEKKAVLCLAIVLFYALIALLSWWGVIAAARGPRGFSVRPD